MHGPRLAPLLTNLIYWKHYFSRWACF